MIRCFIFDFDGTIVDSLGISIAAYNELAEKHKFKKVTQDDFEHLKKLTVMQRCKYVNIPFLKIPLFAGDFYRSYRNKLNNLAMFKGMKELLMELKSKGREIAVISSNSEANIRYFFKANDLECIDQVFCSNDIMGKDKIIEKFMKSKDLKKSDVVYIGDEIRDIKACKKAGVKVAWVSWGYDVLEQVVNESPDYIIDNPTEIMELINK